MNDFSKKESIEKGQNSLVSVNNKVGEEDIFLITYRETPESQWWGCDAHQLINLDYNSYPNIKSLVNVRRAEGGYKFIYNSNKYNPSGLIVDSTFFKVFPFEVKSMDVKDVLKDSNTILLSESFSKKLFGTENPLGKTISIERSLLPKKEYIVTGTVKNQSNSSIQFDFLLPMTYGWMDFVEFGSSFIRTRKDFDKKDFLLKINKEEKNISHFKDYELSIIQLNEIYFNRDLDILYHGVFSKFGDKKNIDMIIVIMLVIFLISGLNFSNLQIITINNSLKKIGVNKINGAGKRHLISEKLTEVGLLIVISLVIISIVYQLILPYFNNYMEVNLTPSLWEIIIINISILSLLAFISLIYPIIIICKISTINSLKAKPFDNFYNKGREWITIFQYGLTFIVLISSVIVTKQLKLLLSKDLGFESKNIITTKLYFPPNDLIEALKNNKETSNDSYQFILNELKSNNSILHISQGQSPIEPSITSWKLTGSDEDFQKINTYYSQSNDLEIFDFKLIEGRFFEDKIIVPQQRHSLDNNVVINEAAKKFWNINDISKVTLQNQNNGYNQIIGVVKDFNYEHLSIKPKPLIMRSGSGSAYSQFFIQFRENAVNSGLKSVESLFYKVNPNEIFKYSFLSDDIAALYKKEKKLSDLYILLTFIALIISAIGLFTIALYDTQRRIKEIGVRKVNGATIKDILIMLNKDFIKWVFVAFVIACPIAYYAMSTWLENFAYKTNLSWWVFALAGIFTLIIALLTVSWQSYQAATQNPVDSLRDE